MPIFSSDGNTGWRIDVELATSCCAGRLESLGRPALDDASPFFVGRASVAGAFTAGLAARSFRAEPAR